MGQYSFTDANDKERSICQAASEHPDSKLTAYFLLPDGQKLEEPQYDGYGVFGGVDAFEWLANVNALPGGREEAIALFYMDRDDPAYKPLITPIKVTYDPAATYTCVGESYACPHQGLPPRPDKAVALEAGVPASLLDTEALSSFDFSDPKVMQAARLLSVFSAEIPNLGMIDPERLENSEDLAFLMDGVINSNAYQELAKTSPYMPDRESLESFLSMLVSDTYYNGNVYSMDALDEALIYFNDWSEPKNKMEPPLQSSTINHGVKVK
ncbi:MAG: hypothetical protein CBC55_04615 [Gammaproteobacteria bacterium TMED95]|uniref:Uncharacterized protein n=1 Tax=Alteromonas mediterranea TaxID=314275 RepID=A0AAC9JEG4_9ALTE|nr:hypothetical protein [Alteromonas mediterranea]APD92290.1 hypothetical protein BM524_20505 [Alteromonas mediterranea]APE00151.1 hypothetical protein BM525_20730 [Alteromonas mediterranea]OUV22081.1 MAG: hypothetical protein CBC55_04615 [Gammaproteobacteria bacterium TMED95]